MKAGADRTGAEIALDAAHAALAAAVHSPGGHTLHIADLLSGILAVFATQKTMPSEMRAAAFDQIANRLVIEAVRLVGRRRAHELVDRAAAAGAGERIS